MDVIPFVWGQAEVGGGAEELPSTGNVEAHWEDIRMAGISRL